MSVGLLLITHEGIAQSLLNTAQKMLCPCPLNALVLEVPLDADTHKLQTLGKEHIMQLQQGDGVLILTDLYGGTPSNIAQQLSNNDNIKMLAGINLPMLIRILNYPQLNLQDMAHKALSGGRDGVLLCDGI